jgi:hypothetical protein
VHGTDPLTGRPVLVASRMSRRGARRLASRLRAEGWDVVARRESLGLLEGASIAAAFAVGFVVVPVLGGLLLGGVAWVLLTRRCAPDLEAALPPPTTPVPPREVPAGTEHAVALGLLFLALAWSLEGPAWLAVPLLAGVAWLVADATRRVVESPAARLTRARLEAQLAVARARVDAVPGVSDQALALLGEIEALQLAFSAGEIDADGAILAAEAIVRRAADLRSSASNAGSSGLLAFRAGIVEAELS